MRVAGWTEPSRTRRPRRPPPPCGPKAWLAVLVCLGAGCASPPARPAATHARDAGATAFLDDLQARTFAFFWELADPRTRLIPDRWPTPSFASVAAVGFGLSAGPIGSERGFVSRAGAAERVEATLRFLAAAPQGPGPRGVAGYRGLFYHFLEMRTGERFEQVELSSIDTALLMAGVLFCQSYFDRPDPRETEIRRLADELYRRVEWDFMQPRPPRLAMGFTPEGGFGESDWHGYDEAVILFVLALGSPTHPVAPEAWSAYTGSYVWGAFQGRAFLQFAPLFGHQYSQIFVDFRGIRDAYMRDKGIDYFENSRRAVQAQRAYAVANPQGFAGYGPDQWGLSACDGPADVSLQVDGRERRFLTYGARGASLTWTNDDGTLTPTALGGSLPFAPEIVLPALVALKQRHGARLYQRYGFLDAFNPTFRFTAVKPRHGRVDPLHGWYDTDYLGIDQGPILAMVENHRSGLVWRVMRRNPYVVRGLRRAGFSGGWLDGEPAERP